MKKNHIILFLALFLSFEGTAQIKKSGIATYSVQLVNFNQNSPKDDYAKLSPHSDAIVKQMKFGLSFNKNGSAFEYIDNKEIKLDNRSLTTTLAYHLDYVSTIWQDAKKSYVETNIGFGENAKRVLLFREKEESKWKITTESKHIGDFLCIKATKKEVLRRGDKTLVRPIVAWFCPELPLPYGPSNYGNLPGLIVELQTERTIFGLSSILFKEISVKDKPYLPLYTEQQVIDSWKEMAGIK